MAGNGWIKLHRAIMDHPVWTTATAEQKSVLIAVLLLASHESKQWAWLGEKFEVRPGQFITSLPSLAKHAGVSVQNVRSALSRFKKLDFLTDKSTAKGRIISIVNWTTYQSSEPEANRQTSRHPTDTQQLSIMKEPKKNPVPSEFEQFWRAYPKKQSKLQAEKAWLKISPDSKLLATIMAALDQQKSSDQWQRDSGQFVPLASTWLNQLRWEDELDQTEQRQADLHVLGGRRVI